MNHPQFIQAIQSPLALVDEPNGDARSLGVFLVVLDVMIPTKAL